MNALAVMGLALGMRHGTDPDHLAAIDGLTRIRPRTTNGIYFALGHALVVMLLAVGIGHFLASRLAFAGPWSLIVIGLVNLWRLLRGAAAPRIRSRPIVVQPLLGFPSWASGDGSCDRGANCLAEDSVCTSARRRGASLNPNVGQLSRDSRNWHAHLLD